MNTGCGKPRYLIDHSTFSHYGRSDAVTDEVDRLALSGTLCACMVTLDEAQFSARNKKDLESLTAYYKLNFRWLPTDSEVESNVERIRTGLWGIGAGRGAQTTDIQIAAVALRHDVIVVHNDTDFVTIQRAVPQFRQLRIGPEPSTRSGPRMPIS